MLTDRYSMYTREVVDRIEEVDPLGSALPSKRFDNELDRFTVTQGFIGRTDLISYMSYETVSLWWLIHLANDIIDSVADMYVGQELIIPSLNDYYLFYDRNKKQSV